MQKKEWSDGEKAEGLYLSQSKSIRSSDNEAFQSSSSLDSVSKVRFSIYFKDWFNKGNTVLRKSFLLDFLMDD